MPDLLASLAGALHAHGLLLRGWLNFRPEEERPPGLSGVPAAAAALVGQAGDAPWPAFLEWRDRQPPGRADPLDGWSREVIGSVARAFGCRAISPSDRPFAPFQQWAMRAEGLRPSPLGILIHPRFGLWHAYRGAFLFSEPLPEPTPPAKEHPCEVCEAKPCLNACPVSAHTAAGFSSAACHGHLALGGAPDCREIGCVARNACPVGAEYRYRAEVQAFHMKAFAPESADVRAVA